MKAARNVLAIIAMAGLCWAAVGLIGWMAWSCIEAVGPAAIFLLPGSLGLSASLVFMASGMIGRRR